MKKSKRKYYGDLNLSAVTDNKKIWKVVKLLFTDKVTTRVNIILLDNNEICENDVKVAEIFKAFFSMAVANLKIQYDKIVNCISVEPDPVLNAIEKYRKHPSIKNIEEQLIKRHSFSFSRVSVGNIINEIADLDETKATSKDSIPPKLINENWDILAQKLLIDFITSVDYASFPNNLTFADVSPAYIKGDRLDKCNYMLVSLLSSFSKIFERLLFNQINVYMDPNIFIFQFGFRKNMSSQKCLDSKGFTGILFTDLSKAFDWLIHDLLLAKLHTYGFQHNALKLIHCYLDGRSQRVRINATYSSWFGNSIWCTTGLNLRSE